MEKDINAGEVFHPFAEDRLKNHFQELNARYQNESLGSAKFKKTGL